MMRKRMISLLLIMIFMAVILGGCSMASDTILKAHEPQDTPETITEQEELDGEQKELDTTPNQGITVNQIDFENLDISMVTEEIAADIEELKLTRGYYYWQQEDGSYLILISAGEKSSGGYGIEVDTVEDNEGKTVISVLETEPAPDTMSIQILTYPYVLIKVAGVTDQFLVRDQNQTEYPLIK